jgi:hypothetical protein
MNALLATLFVHGIPLTGGQRFALLLPLCLSIAVVYKTTRCEHLADVPREALSLWLTIVVGMFAVGFALWAGFEIAI